MKKTGIEQFILRRRYLTYVDVNFFSGKINTTGITS
jgi:hypothetical protein